MCNCNAKRCEASEANKEGYLGQVGAHLAFTPFQHCFTVEVVLKIALVKALNNLAINNVKQH